MKLQSKGISEGKIANTRKRAWRPTHNIATRQEQHKTLREKATQYTEETTQYKEETT